jgi:hypothetical protein
MVSHLPQRVLGAVALMALPAVSFACGGYSSNGAGLMVLMTVPALLVASRFSDQGLMRIAGVPASSAAARIISRRTVAPTMLAMFFLLALPMLLAYIDSLLPTGFPLWFNETVGKTLVFFRVAELPIPYFFNNGGELAVSIGMALILSMVVWLIVLPFRLRAYNDVLGMSAYRPRRMMLLSIATVFGLSLSAWFVYATYSASEMEARHVLECSKPSPDNVLYFGPVDRADCQKLSGRYPEIKPRFLEACIKDVDDVPVCLARVYDRLRNLDNPNFGIFSPGWKPLKIDAAP